MPPTDGTSRGSDAQRRARLLPRLDIAGEITLPGLGCFTGAKRRNAPTSVTAIKAPPALRRQTAQDPVNTAMTGAATGAGARFSHHGLYRVHHAFLNGAMYGSFLNLSTMTKNPAVFTFDSESTCRYELGLIHVAIGRSQSPSDSPKCWDR